jgi:hypothetical protein
MNHLFFTLVVVFSSFVSFCRADNFALEHLSYKINEEHTEVVIDDVGEINGGIRSYPGYITPYTYIPAESLSLISTMLDFSQTFPNLQQIKLVDSFRSDFYPWVAVNNDLGIGLNPNLKTIIYDGLYSNELQHSSLAKATYFLQFADLPNLETLIYNSPNYPDHFLLHFEGLKNIQLPTSYWQFRSFLQDLHVFMLDNLENVDIDLDAFPPVPGSPSYQYEMDLLNRFALERPDVHLNIHVNHEYSHNRDYGPIDKAQLEAEIKKRIDDLNSHFQGTNIKFDFKHFDVYTWGSQY